MYAQVLFEKEAVISISILTRNFQINVYALDSKADSTNIPNMHLASLAWWKQETFSKQSIHVFVCWMQNCFV